MAGTPLDPKALRRIKEAEVLARLQAKMPPVLPGAVPLPAIQPPPPPAKPQALRKPTTPKAQPSVADIDPAVYRAVAQDLYRDGRTLNRVSPKKRRRHGMSLSCSQEEYELLMSHVDEIGVPFSQWARETLFRAMGRKVPARPKRG